MTKTRQGIAGDLKSLAPHRPLIPANPAALQFCWHIRLGLFYKVEPDRLKAYADYFYSRYLHPHLRSQEALLQKLPRASLVSKKMRSSQRRLRRLFCMVTQLHKVLGQIEDTLEQHVRLEQKLLFPQLYTACAGNRTAIKKLAEEFYDPALSNALKSWRDQFWEKETLHFN